MIDPVRWNREEMMSNGQEVSHDLRMTSVVRLRTTHYSLLCGIARADGGTVRSAVSRDNIESSKLQVYR